jgi:CpeT/CpcT family (DUF1001)
MKLLNLLAVFLCLAEGLAAQKNNPAKNLLRDELTMMMKWFEGEFDNFQQIYKEKEDKLPDVHEHIHSIFKKISLPVFGENVFYVLQYMDGDSTKIYRQRIYSFKENKIENAIQLEIYSFTSDSLYYYSHIRPEKLNGLTPAQMTKTDGCEVYWKKDGERFIGYMKEKACNLISKRSGKKIFITDSLVLTKNEIWIRDEAYDENGGYVFGHKGKIPHKLKRCRFYKGWMLLEKAGLTGEYHQYRNQLWHDQGKRVRLFTEEGKATKYEVELALVVYGKDLEVLKIALYETGTSKAIMYAWASPGSNNIGINLRWFQCGLTLL